MIYRSERKAYVPVMEVLKGEANDVLICREASAESESYHTLLAIRDHETVRRLLCVMEQFSYGYDCCLEMFGQEGVYCVVFPYVKERYLKRFYMPAQITWETRGEICENLILACMLSKLPKPLLYLALEQEQIHLRKDNSVELGYAVRLEELEEEIGERECARQCAALLRELLRPESGEGNMAYRLFMKKWEYETFDSLYRDFRLVKGMFRRQEMPVRLRLLFWSRRQEFLKLLRAACVGVIFLALVSWLSELVWGELPFARIGVNHFQKIGTMLLGMAED